MRHSHDSVAWPFTDPTDTGAYTTLRVLNEDYPILLVTHDEDGAWQVLCGTTNDSDDGRLACLGCLFLRDPSIGELADLPLGWRASRESAGFPWHREASARSRDPEVWDQFVETAIDYLYDRQEALKSTFKLDSWERYYYDQEAGTLTFSSDDIGGFIADMEVVGSISNGSGTWMWSWANPTILDQVRRGMDQVRVYGEANGFEKLRNAEWSGNERDGWEMTAVAAYILKAEGAYRAPDDDGALFMILSNVRWPA